MAKAILNIEKKLPNQAEEDAKSLEQILKAVGNQREALLAMLDVMEQLQKLGVLDMARGFLQNSRQIGAIGIQQMNKPGAHRMIKNGMAAMQFLTQVDPNKLQTVLNGMAGGLDAAVQQDTKQKRTGLWGMMKSVREPAVMSSMAMMLRFLKGMGNGLKQQTH